MKPKILDTRFGSILLKKKEYDHDIVIDVDGHVSKRKKKLSKAIYGTSHTLSLDEIKHVFQNEMEELIIGSGQYGMVTLSKEAAEFLHGKNCHIMLLPTPEAIEYWNAHKGKAGALFHVTC